MLLNLFNIKILRSYIMILIFENLKIIHCCILNVKHKINYINMYHNNNINILTHLQTLDDM